MMSFPSIICGGPSMQAMTSVGNVGTDSVRDCERVRNHQAQQHFVRQHVLSASQGRTLYYTAPSFQSKSGSLNEQTTHIAGQDAFAKSGR